ncbi:MAG: AAA family ATPase [Bacteroidota bacterium]
MATKRKASTILSVSNFAQIRDCSVEFGDFTLIVGPQASGKSIFLQLFKLLVDRNQIFETLEKHAYTWGSKDFARLLDLYFGESMSGIWKEDTRVNWNDKNQTQLSIINRQGSRDTSKVEKMFYVPAQRVVTMSQGWPRPFNNFDAGDPYILKSFSETLRVLMELEFSNGRGNVENIFPKPGKMSVDLRNQIDSSIFYGASINLDKKSPRKRFLLKVGDNELPYMTWSAGQKEFMPLLLSLYHLIPAGNSAKKDDIDWVIIEEPEMGLHPQAVQTVMLLALQLIQRGYKVVISTHSPVLLEMAWVINQIKNFSGSADDLFDLFGIKKNPLIREIFKVSIDKEYKTWYFEREKDGIHVRDISTLDPGSENPDTANWGGLSEFASRAGEVVSKLAAK